MTPSPLRRLLPVDALPLQRWLDTTRGAVLAPVRAEIFGIERFAQHGHSLALTHRAERTRWRRANFFPRLRSNIRVLREAQLDIATHSATGHDISPAAEWLLDNFHLIEAQLKAIHEGLPRSYFRSLPVLLDEPLAGLPRVYGVAWAFVAHTDSAFDEDLLVHFLRAYQATRDLTLSETWALPTTLRVVLVENLRRVAERVASAQAARKLANLCCDRIEAWSPRRLNELLALLEQRGVGHIFLLQIGQRLLAGRAIGDALFPAQQREWLRGALPDLAAAQAQQNADQAADNLTVSNAVISLRTIGDADWPDLVARTSPLMQVMMGSAVFAAEDTGTRDQALHGIERLARRSGRGEVEVARTLIGLLQAAEQVDGADPSCSVANHWLRGPGELALLQALGLPFSDRLLAPGRWQAPLRRITLPAYISLVMLGTAALAAWLLRQPDLASASPLWHTPWAWLVAALALVPASEATVAVVNRLIGESLPPHPLPRLALGTGIPAEHRVMVVIPALLTDTRSIQALVHRLHLHHLANPERHAQFALLSDGIDADTPRLPGDEALLQTAQNSLQQLNLRHPAATDEAPRFILLHRARRFSHSEQRWIGWERKRGKLEQLIQVLATGVSAPFMDLGEASRIAAGMRYIVTLDSDTQLPPGRLRELVGVAAHPDNQPRLDTTARSVLQGHAILQPRLVTPLPDPAETTHFHQLFAGQCGVDPYSAASSEVYQDLFGEGSFTGKGLLHVQALHAVLGGRLPEDRVLSHDLLEGQMARCAAVSDVTLIEDAPFHADVAASRVHRWTRGDWQLLPFLLAPRRYGLGAVGCLKIVDNLRRSLVAPASLLLLLLSVAGVFGSPWAAGALVLAAYAAGPLMGALTALAPSRDDVAARHFYRQATGGLVRVIGGAWWHLGQLLPQAMAAADAIVRALYRLFISHRHLLQWTTAAAAQAQAVTALPALLRRHARVPAVALLLLAVLLATGVPHPALATVLCLAWAASPVAIWWVSRPRRPHNAADTLSTAERDYLAGIARDTWRYFERCVGPLDHHLPPDNLQITPHEMLAHRTSPTNIGLYLLSVACAREFGWIGTPEMLQRLEATLATLLTLQRHRGHFLNWYDTQSCAPLLPMYVSTVDSGNLSGHLLAVSQACLERRAEVSRDAAAPACDDTAHRLQALAERFEQLANEANFGFLYHRKRHLFHIGYRVAEQALDTGFYDLLASESRLTGLLAIAKGDVPVRHWAALGRPFFATGADAGLRSWSGSMFEYLMPTLVLHEPHGSALHEACRAALKEQMAFARLHGVPWGISESAYAGSDHTLAYQYAPQGVPRLALRRTPPDELVIAPYATALAALVAPRAALANFRRLELLSARGAFGFIDALDYTPGRQLTHAAFTPVNTYMAHHQGMTIVALAHVLLDAPAQRWCQAHAPVEAVSSLLHERAPSEVSMLESPPALAPSQAEQRRPPGLLREVLPGVQAIEPTHLLSNGRYSVSLRANGAGCSRWGGTGITRWRDDALRDEHGSFLYLRWDQQPEPVSLTQHPAPDPAAQYRSVFHADRVCFDATWPGLQAHTTVWVSPEDDIEFRQVELHNAGDRTLEIELISTFEVTLADARADESHPAFSNLFVQAEWLPAQQAVRFSRKPRLQTETALHAAHFLAGCDMEPIGLGVQTDRQRWLGRGRNASCPLAVLDPVPADGQGPTALVTGLDPVCALSVRLRIAPQGKARLTFATAASDKDETLRAVIDKYRQLNHVERASLMSATLAGIRLRGLRLTPENTAAVHALTTALVLSLSRPQAGLAEVPAASAVCDRRLLWRLGISGERPLILVSASVMQGLGLLRTLAQALRLWSRAGVVCDLVVVNAEPASYQMALQREIAALRDRHGGDTAADAHPGGHTSTALHLLRAEELSADEMGTLQALARVRFEADGRPLAHHVQEWIAHHEEAAEQRQAVSVVAVGLGTPNVLQQPVADGIFDAPSGEFRFEVGGPDRPARPWINVLSNPGFGAQISESGGGYSWAQNSRLNQLTAWSNDAVADPPSEWFLLQDLRTLEVWSVAPSVGGDRALRYRVAHGQGYSVVRHRRGEVEVTATWCVDAASAVKQVQINLLNHGTRPLHWRIVGIAEWMMGATRADRGTVSTALFRQRLPDQPGAGGRAPAEPRKLTALMATQHEQAAGFGGGTAFLALAGRSAEAEDWTCDRRECFDARGRLVLPDHFGQSQGAGLDPCAALSTRVRLAAGESAQRVFLLGYGTTPDAARQLAAEAAVLPAPHRVRRVREHWNDLLGATTVSTPDPLFDALVNRWLIYQTVACRLWAKAGFYQAGGATGFRDQLQDTMALAWAAPGMLREQILRCAARQFPEGDVQHWWHEPQGAGVRTHFSDDLLWLPFALAHHLRCTGDTTLLDEQVPFIEGPAIPDGAEDAYNTPTVSGLRATVYEHAARTIDHSLRVGAHGLPLMGSGDWNDGMNRVGHGGRGESVWLAWFLCRVVADFAPWAQARGDHARAQRWLAAAEGWTAALAGPAWDGQWFRRAFFDDGQSLGSSANAEARIDLIAQAWAVLSGVAQPALQRLAMAAVENHLVDTAHGLIRLLDPPLVHSQPDAGYIQAYPPGVRENGGQYAHAGVWALMAQAQLAVASGAPSPEAADRVWRSFRWLSPAHRAQDPVQGAAYGLEPYVMAADVYSQPPYAGRGGWSWYTGSAGWMHRATIESIFGLQQDANTVLFRPCLPSHWARAELMLQRDSRSLRVIFLRDTAAALQSLLHSEGATLLQTGQPVRWRELAAEVCFVIALPAAGG